MLGPAQYSEGQTLSDANAIMTSTTVDSAAPVALSIALRRVSNLQKSLRWAWLDIICQYRRSKIGPLWETINIVVMTLGIAVVSSAVFGGRLTNLIGYISLGIIAWSAVSSLITEGSNAFVRNAAMIRDTNISIDLYIGRTVFKTLITFGHHLILYFAGLLFFLVPLTWASLLAILGIALLFVNGFWVVTLLAFICARFRDVELIVRNLLQLAFFVTPVFWNYQQVDAGHRYIVDLNPIFYFIEIIRAPLLGYVPPVRDYLVVIGMTAVGYIVAYAVFVRMRRPLAFFV